MATRKETPDVLGQLLGAEKAAPQPLPEPEPQEAPSPPPKPKRKPPARKTSRRRPAKPPRWEYMEILFRDYGGLRPRFVNGEEQPEWKALPVIRAYLNQLGEEGWELAGIGSRHKDQIPVYLKRPKA